MTYLDDLHVLEDLVGVLNAHGDVVQVIKNILLSGANVHVGGGHSELAVGSVLETWKGLADGVDLAIEVSAASTQTPHLHSSIRSWDDQVTSNDELLTWGAGAVGDTWGSAWGDTHGSDGWAELVVNLIGNLSINRGLDNSSLNILNNGVRVILIPEDCGGCGTLGQSSWSGDLSTVDWISCLANGSVTYQCQHLEKLKSCPYENMEIVVNLPRNSGQGDLLSLASDQAGGDWTNSRGDEALAVLGTGQVWLDVLDILLVSYVTADGASIQHLAGVADIVAKSAVLMLVSCHLRDVGGRLVTLVIGSLDILGEDVVRRGGSSTADLVVL